jgi:hypothetical protein
VVKSTPELVCRPGAETRVGIGGEVRRIDVAERRFDRSAAGEKAPAARGVAAGAVAGAGERFAARQQLGAGLGTRRSRPQPFFAVKVEPGHDPGERDQHAECCKAADAEGATQGHRGFPAAPPAVPAAPVAGTPPQAIGIGVANPARRLRPGRHGWPASHAEIRPISSGASFFAIAAMQSGSWATRLPLRQAPSWALR